MNRMRWRAFAPVYPFIFMLMFSTAADCQRALANSSELAIPPAPTRFFNDYAHLVSEHDADRLNERLAKFGADSSNQVVVAIFPELPSPSLEDFTIRTAHAWRVGQKKLDNGVVLFVFVKDHKSRLEVGYGLEDKIPDAVAKRILQDVLAPQFKQGQYAAGLDATIAAILQATQGSYSPPATRRAAASHALALLASGIIIVFVALVYGGLRTMGTSPAEIRKIFASLLGVLLAFFVGLPLIIYLIYWIVLGIQVASFHFHSNVLSSLLNSSPVHRAYDFVWNGWDGLFIPIFLVAIFGLLSFIRLARNGGLALGSGGVFSGNSSSGDSSSGGSDSSSGGGSYSSGGGDFGGGGASGSW